MASLTPARGSLLRQGAAAGSVPLDARDPRADRQISTRRLGTGFESLDRTLPDGGWPPGALTEILSDRQGVGELGLVTPALAEITRAGCWVVWIAPPHVPYAPALAARGIDLSRVLWISSPSGSSGATVDHLWAAEQALRQAQGGAVLIWLKACPREDRVLRRLQIAAEAGGSWGVLYRPAEAANRPSPAAVRLRLESSTTGISVRVLKCRGRAPLESVMTL